MVSLSTPKSTAYEGLTNHITFAAPSVHQPCLCVLRRHCPLVLRNGFKTRTGRYLNLESKKPRTLLFRLAMRLNGSTSTWPTFSAKIKCMIQYLRQSRPKYADKIQECHRNFQNARKTPRKNSQDKSKAKPSRDSSGQYMSKDTDSTANPRSSL